MDIFYVVGVCVVVLCSMGFAIMTNKVIADQDREIAALKAENKRLRKAKKPVKVFNLYEQPKGYNVPEFKEW